MKNAYFNAKFNIPFFCCSVYLMREFFNIFVSDNGIHNINESPVCDIFTGLEITTK